MVRCASATSIEEEQPWGYFAGLDVSLEETTVCIVDDASAICVEPRQAKAAMGAMPNKTDRNDARGLA